MTELRQSAFYYPGVIWHDAGWVKALALFFDEVSLLVPDYMKDRPLKLDPAIAEPMVEAGLLRILSPETLVGQDATQKLATAMTDVIASGVLDNLPDGGPFQELSWSRMGGFGDPGLAGMIFDELKARGLARPTEDGASIPMHGVVRSLYLVLLAQILREAGSGIGLDLCPATDRPKVQEALIQLLSASAPDANAATVVSVDLEVVGPDLNPVPLNDVLAFRAEHGKQFRAYARRLREIVRVLAAVPPEEQEKVLSDRREELREASESLRSGPTALVGAAAGIGLGIAGGIATVVTGGLLPGLLGAGAATGGLATLPRRTTTPYSYLFSMRERFA